jgi:hypothetical protein
MPSRKSKSRGDPHLYNSKRSLRRRTIGVGARTIAAAQALNVPRVAEVVREQRRRHREVLELCKVEPRQVRVLAKKLGVRLGPTERVPGVPEDIALRNTCHVLGTAMSTLFRGQGNYAYPIKVAGSGIAGLVFFMSDGSVIKTFAVYAPGRKPRDGGGLLPRSQAIPLHEFGHEVVMTRAARRRFKGTGVPFRVPRVPRVIVLRGRSGARIGVMQQSRAPGITVGAFLRNTSNPKALRMAVAAAHGKALGTLHAAGWVHGDLHTENAMVEVSKGNGKHAAAPRIRFTIIDWGRSNTRHRIMAHSPSEESGRALWTRFVRYETAFPYNDMATNGPGRAIADAYLDAYIRASGAAKGKGPIGEKLVDPQAIRRDYHGLVNNNVSAMFRALSLVAPHTARGAKRPAARKGTRSARSPAKK